MEHQVIITSEQFERLKAFEKLHENKQVIIDYMHCIANPYTAESKAVIQTVDETINQLANDIKTLQYEFVEMHNAYRELKQHIMSISTRRELGNLKKLLTKTK